MLRMSCSDVVRAGAVAGLLLFGAAGCQSDEGTQVTQAATAGEAGAHQNDQTETHVADPLNFQMTRLNSEAEDLSKYRGQVVLMVNTASKCGLTPQYEGLQQLYDAYGEHGLVVLGFPANNFGGQEPGSDEQIAEFCQANYGVTFPMFSKISVKGEDQHPLYALLTSAEVGPAEPGEVKWNFEKFLISRDGEVVARFSPKTQPQDSDIIAAIERELARRPEAQRNAAAQ